MMRCQPAGPGFVRAAAAIWLAGSLAPGIPFAAEAAGGVADWPYYGGDAGGQRYSPLTQIDKKNVGRLKIAWEYHTGDVSDGSGGRRKSAFEATPIVAFGTMYLTTPLIASWRSTRKPERKNGGSIRRSTCAHPIPKA